MTYENMMGLGFVQTNRSCGEGRFVVAGAPLANGRLRCVTQVDMIDSDEPSGASDGCAALPAAHPLANEVCHDPAQPSGGGDGEYWCCPVQGRSAPVAPAAGETRPMPDFDTAPIAEKQTWWTGDIEGMVSSFFSKVGISEAQAAGREAGRAPPPGPTSIRDVVPDADAPPRVEVEDENGATPWYVRYTPHLVIGGVSLGAIITLALVMRNR